MWVCEVEGEGVGELEGEGVGVSWRERMWV